MNPGPSDSGFHFLSDYLRCQQYFAWRYIMNLEPRWPAPTLLFGEAYHKAMEEWYNSLSEGTSTVERLDRSVKAFQGKMSSLKEKYKFPDTWSQDLSKGLRAINEYALEYPGETWKVLATEGSYKVPLKSGDRFTGRIDLVVQGRQERRYIIDHKTTSWALASLIRTLNCSDQATGYLWLWNANHPDLSASVVMFNIIRIYNEDITFSLHAVSKTGGDIERFSADVEYTFEEIANKIADPGSARWLRNTGSCYIYNRACPYLNLCRGDSYRALIGTEFVQGGTQ